MKIYNLSNVSHWNSRNGYGMEASLFVDGKKIADFYDSGDGSQPDFDVIDKDLFREYEMEIDKLPVQFISAYGTEIKIDKYLFIDLLYYALETKQPLKLIA